MTDWLTPDTPKPTLQTCAGCWRPFLSEGSATCSLYCADTVALMEHKDNDPIPRLPESKARAMKRSALVDPDGPRDSLQAEDLDE